MKRIKSKFFRRRKRNALSRVKHSGTGISPESQKGNYMLTWGWPQVPISYMTRLSSSFSLYASRVLASGLQQRAEEELHISLTILKCLDSETILNETCLVSGLSLCKPIPQKVHFSVNTTTATGKKDRKNSKCYPGMCRELHLWTQWWTPIWNQHRPQGGKEKGEEGCHLPSVAPISIVPFTWLKHHSVSWVSVSIPESDTKRHLRLGKSYPWFLKGQEEKKYVAWCISNRRLAHQGSSCTEETLARSGRMVVLPVPSRLCLLPLTMPGLVWAGAIGVRPFSVPGSILEQFQRACSHSPCDCPFSWE